MQKNKIKVFTRFSDKIFITIWRTAMLTKEHIQKIRFVEFVTISIIFSLAIFFTTPNTMFCIGVLCFFEIFSSLLLQNYLEKKGYISNSVNSSTGERSYYLDTYDWNDLDDYSEKDFEKNNNKILD